MREARAQMDVQQMKLAIDTAAEARYESAELRSLQRLYDDVLRAQKLLHAALRTGEMAKLACVACND